MPILVSTDLIDRARSGDPARTEALLEAVWPQAYRLARAIVLDSRSAEDVAQEACVDAFRTIRSLRSSDAFGTWFYRIVVREASKHKKAAMRSSLLDAEIAYEPDFATHVDLWRALNTLPVEQRTAVVLYYFERLRTREIAAILRVPDATVRFRLMRARGRLKHMLAPLEISAHAKDDKRYAI